MRQLNSARARLTATAAGLLILIAMIPMAAPAKPRRKKEAKSKGEVVYVCACLGDRSCSCMTEAKTEGPCSCGTSGGPPMKAVKSQSSWAKANRQALAK